MKLQNIAEDFAKKTRRLKKRSFFLSVLVSCGNKKNRMVK
jgi:hypothetical protein